MHRKKLIVAALAAVLSLGAASPAFADCCDSFFDCAATVVTEGVSCAMQEFIDAVKGLVTFVNNLLNQATGATQDATHSAQQFVSNTIDDITSQSQSANTVLAQAAASAKQLADEEKQFPVFTAQKVGSSPSASAGSNSSASSTPSRPANANKTSSAQGSSSSSNSHVMHASSAAATNATTSTSSNSHTTTMHAAVATSVEPISAAAPARAYMDVMNRALAEITKAKAAGDHDFATVNQYMTDARNSEGSGLKSASQIADAAVEAPFKNLLSQLTSMLANPTELTAPSSAIEAAANSIMSNVNVSIGQIVDAITNGPIHAFEATQGSYTDLQYQADHAKAIADAMDHLFRDRTTAAAAALEALLPKVAAKPEVSLHAMSNLPNHLAYSTVMSKFTAGREKVKSDYAQRLQGLSARMTQYEAARAKYRTARSSLPAARASFSSKLDGYLTGKTAAERTAQRDSLIAQARSRFANDPKTRDAVIALLTSESNKRIAMIKK